MSAGKFGGAPARERGILRGMDRIAPTLRPDDRPRGFQRWRTLLFLHWEVPADAVRALIPSELSVDTFDGKAYVGVVPFTMRDVTPWWSPSVPGISNFHELNVRTYVHYRGREPGVWFFSLDAAGTIAVLAARAGWGLPYFRASMDLSVQNNEVHYWSERRWPKPVPANLECHYRIGKELGAAEPGTFEHFLAERYILYTRRSGGKLLSGRVHHKPYPLWTAEVEQVSQSMVKAAGLPHSDEAPLVLYSPGVDVDIFDLKPVE